jgi:hypothetical protein
MINITMVERTDQSPKTFHLFLNSEQLMNDSTIRIIYPFRFFIEKFSYLLTDQSIFFDRFRLNEYATFRWVLTIRNVFDDRK